MSTMVAESKMAKRTDTPVRIDNDVVEDSRVAASLLGKSLSEFMSETLRPVVRQIVKDAYAKKYGSSEGPKPKR